MVREVVKNNSEFNETIGETMMRKSYEDMLRKIVKQFKGEKVTIFSGMHGCKYNNELLFIGRATNGWEEYNMNELSEALSNDKGRLISKIIENNKNECPLRWVNSRWKNKKYEITEKILEKLEKKKIKLEQLKDFLNNSFTEQNLVNKLKEKGFPEEEIKVIKECSGNYNTAESPFWRVIKKLCWEFGIKDEDNWASYIAWSNLYKISHEIGNPTGEIITIQFEDCKDILEKEIDVFKPKRIVFLTGWGWLKHFVDRLEIRGDINIFINSNVKDFFILKNNTKVSVTKHPQLKYVEASFVLKDNIKVVVAKHPQRLRKGEKEIDWVKEVYKHLSR